MMRAKLVATTAIVTLLPAVGYAQSSAASRDSGIDEIVVTAQRYAERLENVPMSITAIDPAKLAKSGVVNFDNLDKIAVGTMISRSGVFTQPQIRGISTRVLGPGQENNVAVYVDGIFDPASIGLGGDLLAVSDIQVLKGPQGTLYGRNATGGAILVNTLDPSDHFEGKISATYGRYNDRGGQVYVSVPLSPKVAFNVAGNYHENDGYIHDLTGVYPIPHNGIGRDVARTKNWEARLKVKAELSDNFTALIGYSHRRMEDSTALAFNYSSFAVFPQDTTARDTVSVSVPPYFDTDVDRVWGKLELDTGIGKLTSLTAYTNLDIEGDTDYDGNKVDLIRSGIRQPTNAFQQSVFYNITAIERLNLTVGGEYYHNYGAFDPVHNNAFGSSSGSVNKLRTNAYAAYLDGTYEIADRWFLTAGVRWAQEKRSYTSFFATGFTGQFQYTGIGASLLPSSPLEKTFSRITTRATVRYQITPDSNVYASFSQGFKSGTFNTLTQGPVASLPPNRPETIDAWEVGFKTKQNNIRFDAAAFYYDYKDLQVNRYNVVAGSVVTLLENAAKARNYGAEATLTWSATDRLNIQMGGAWTHARYVSYPFAAANIPQGGVIVSAQQDFGGLQLERAPDWTFNASADYTFPFANGSALTLAANFYYSSSYAPVSDSFDPATGKGLYRQGSYTLTNGSVTWTDAENKYAVTGYVNNIFNTRYLIYINAGDLGVSQVFSQPTTYGVRLSYNF
jgi:iron complex outermembrane receptor protein